MKKINKNDLSVHCERMNASYSGKTDGGDTQTLQGECTTRAPYDTCETIMPDYCATYPIAGCDKPLTEKCENTFECVSMGACPDTLRECGGGATDSKGALCCDRTHNGKPECVAMTKGNCISKEVCLETDICNTIRVCGGVPMSEEGTCGCSIGCQ